MSDINIVAQQRDGNRVRTIFDGKVNEPQKRHVSPGLQALLDALSEPGDVLDLDKAVEIVSRYHASPYLHIVTGMNRGLLEADFLDCPWVDREVVIRRR